LADHLKTLKEASVATDGPALLAFFRERTLTVEKKAKLTAAVKRLGDNAFAVRERAATELIASGQAAVPFLKAALKDPDLEVARRADQCLQAIESGTQRAVAVAAAKVLAARPPGGAADVLLAYLPSTGDDTVEEAVVNALSLLGIQNGAADPAIRKAASDPEPVRRAAAAFVLGKAKPEPRQALVGLLKDPDAKVRFHAARSLVRNGDKSAVPVLMRLLGDAPEAVAMQAE